MARRRSNFGESAKENNRNYMRYLERITELAISRYQWEGLPDTVNERYLEKRLFETGAVVYFNDEEIGNLCLDCLLQGNFDVYGYPIDRRAYSSYNNYNRALTNEDSVIIFNNYLRTPGLLDAQVFAKRLWDLDRIIDVNARAQKTPVLVKGTEKERLTLLNLYKEFDGNAPVIFGDKSLSTDSITVLRTDAPYVADKLYTLKTQIWNECLMWLGIDTANAVKKERLISDEVEKGNGATIANRYSGLAAREEAAEKINAMFGTSISVHYRDTDEYDDHWTPEEEGEEDE